MNRHQGIEFQDSRIPTSDLLQQVLHGITSEQVTLRDILSMLGEQGLLLICILMSLPFLFPVSIPGVSTVFGAGIVLIAFAITINRLPSLPGFIADKKLEAKKLIPVLQRGVILLRRIDRYLKPRLPYLTMGMVMNRINGLTLMLSGILLMMPLSFIPFSNTIPGFAILFLASGISQRDGLLVALGYFLVTVSIFYFSGLAWLFYSAGQSLPY